jgi:hypothetical protein
MICRRLFAPSSTAIALSAAALLAPLSLEAQSADSARVTSASNCYRFSFGPWDPPLDLVAAGHAPVPKGGLPHSAPNGRDWAVRDVASASDSTLLLLPGWWPAGVLVRLARASNVVTDTVLGVATAYVADARQRSPTSPVRAWLVPCAGGGSRPPR